MALVAGVSGVKRIWPISMGLRKAQAMAPPVVLTMSKYMFMQKGATQRDEREVLGIELNGKKKKIQFKYC